MLYTYFMSYIGLLYTLHRMNRLMVTFAAVCPFIYTLLISNPLDLPSLFHVFLHRLASVKLHKINAWNWFRNWASTPLPMIQIIPQPFLLLTFMSQQCQYLASSPRCHAITNTCSICAQITCCSNFGVCRLTISAHFGDTCVASPWILDLNCHPYNTDVPLPYT